MTALEPSRAGVDRRAEGAEVRQVPDGRPRDFREELRKETIFEGFRGRRSPEVEESRS